MSQTKHSVYLLVVHFWDLVSRHVLNVVVILYHAIRIYSGHVRLLKSLSEDSGIFLVKEHVDPIKAALLLGVIPETLVPLTLEILLDPAASPVAETVFVFPETLGANALSGRVNILGSLEPVDRLLRIKFLIIVGFKWQPSAFSFLRVSEFDSLFKYKKFELIRTIDVALVAYLVE